MENILLIAQIVVLFALAAFALYFIVVLVRVKSILVEMETNVKHVSAKLLPTLDNMEVITAKLRVVLENFDEQMLMLRSSVETVREVADEVASFERRVQEAIESPVMEVMNTIGGIIRGFSSFITRVTSGSSSD